VLRAQRGDLGRKRGDTFRDDPDIVPKTFEENFGVTAIFREAAVDSGGEPCFHIRQIQRSHQRSQYAEMKSIRFLRTSPLHDDDSIQRGRSRASLNGPFAFCANPGGNPAAAVDVQSY